MKPAIGRIVHYKLSAEDAAQINRRRTNSYSIADRIKEEKWPLGAQAHIGNEAHEGDIHPMIIIRVWSDSCVNGQVFLDGTDLLWKTSPLLGEQNGQWNWPVITN
jgi:hypothetical protein